MSSSPAIARVAASSAAEALRAAVHRGPRPCGVDGQLDDPDDRRVGSIRRVEEQPAQPRVAVVRPEGERRQTLAKGVGRGCGQGTGADDERGQRWRGDLEHGAPCPREVEDPLERARDPGPVPGWVALPCLQRLQSLDQRQVVEGGSRSGPEISRVDGEMGSRRHRREPTSPDRPRAPGPSPSGHCSLRTGTPGPGPFPNPAASPRTGVSVTVAPIAVPSPTASPVPTTAIGGGIE